MKAKIFATELGREFASALSRVRRQGESFLIGQDGEAVATLEPVEALRGATWRTLIVALRDLPIGDIDVTVDLEDVQRHQAEMPTSAWLSGSTRASSSRSNGNSAVRTCAERTISQLHTLTEYSTRPAHAPG